MNDSINIEVGHITAATYKTPPTYFAKSIELGVYVKRVHEKRNKHASLSVLLDDKGCKAQQIGESIQRVVDARVVDFLVMETELEYLMSPFLALLPTNKRARIDKEVTRYKRKRGELPCSTSIALWHLYRLGQLGSDDGLVRPLTSNGFSSGSFFANYVVSILPSRVEDDEKKASKDYLDHTPVQRQIYRHYLAPNAKTSR